MQTEYKPSVSRSKAHYTSPLAIVSLCLFSALAMAIGALASPDIGVATLLAGTMVTVLLLLAGDDAVGLGVLLFVMSACQRAVFAVTSSGAALYLDDIVLIPIALLAVYRLLRRGRLNRWILLAAALVLVSVGLAFAQARGTDIGVYQARQILVPVILLLFGAALHPGELRRLRPLVIALGVIAAVYAVFEQFDVRLIDPRSYGGFQSSGDLTTYGRDFPGFYYYYFSDADFFVRSGGFLLNPPSLGMYIAGALCWLWFDRPANAKMLPAVLLSLLLTLGAILTMARGGFVIIAVLALQPVVLRRVGRFGFLIVGGLVGAFAFTQFVSAGSSARHSEGALYGFNYALTHPLGGGFGAAGNAVHTLTDEVSEAGESLTTVFLASCGWIALVLVAVLLVRGLAKHGGVPGAALTAAVIVAVFSETAAGLDASGFLWILGGVALKPGLPKTGRLRDDGVGLFQ